MPDKIWEENGYLKFVRWAGDKMGFEGMAEIYLCLAEQYPDLSRQDIDLEAFSKDLFALIKKHHLNQAEFTYVIDYTLNPDTYTHH